MKNLIIGIITGGLIGSGVTYYICKKRHEADLEDLKESYRHRQEIEEEEEEAIKNHVKKVPDKPVEIKEYEDMTEEYKSSDPAEEEYPEDDEPDVDPIEENTVVDDLIQEHLENTHPQPKIITLETFGELRNYDTETINYYVEDKMLVHEDETIVDDVAFLVGDALDRYGWADDDSNEDALYVRNYRIQKDFEIVKIFGEFYTD